MATILSRVCAIDALIKQAMHDEIQAIEPDSTWESAYEFMYIELKKTRIKIVYWEYNGISPKLIKDITLLSAKDDVTAVLSWVRRAINKGYKQAKKENNE